MEAEGSDRDAPSALVRRVCDQCRLRKIRCDKRSPCANCRSSGILCRSTGEGQKPQEPRRRVLISSQYEKKIDLIDERLGGIEETLRELLKASSQQHAPRAPRSRELYLSPSSQPASQPRSSPGGQNQFKSKGPGYKTNPAIEQHDSSSGFEGGSSLAAHSTYASQFLESAVSQGGHQVLSSPKINAALTSLKQIVGLQSQRRGMDAQGPQLSSPKNRPGPRCDLRDLEMPPLPVVLEVLRKVKENPPASFGGYIPFFPVEYFIEKCREIYFCTDDHYSDATFIVVNLGLYNTFFEFGISEKDAATREECQHYNMLCRENVEAALANLNLLMPATHDSIIALTMGAMHAIEISKPSVGWTLASTAVHMCQTLGYHRLASMEHDGLRVQRQKQQLFWSVYVIMNNISLRLGRASAIQIHDICLPSPIDSFDNPEPWATVCALWTQQAKIQSKTYELLYSPSALKQPESERVLHARRLAVEMQSSVIEPHERILFSDYEIPEFDRMYLRSDKVSRLAILTLIYRAIPGAKGSGSSSTFIPECIDTARAALECHQDCINSLQETDDAVKCSYMHWAIFLSPFVPFIVIFCHVITAPQREDLALLEDFIASLRPLCAFSQSIDRLHNLCSVLGTVARLYFEASNLSQTDEDHDTLASVGQEFDVYLSALGLAPNNATADTPNYFQPDVPAMTVGALESPQHPAGIPLPPDPQLASWFWGNRYMMGLLEEDFSRFNPDGWSWGKEGS